MTDVLKRLEAKGLRATLARVKLLTVLAQSGEERLTAEEIFMRVAQGGDSLSLASVYRVLKELSRHGLAERGWRKEGLEIRLLFSRARDGQEGLVPQLACVSCDRTMPVPLSTLRGSLNRLAKDAGLAPGDRPITIRIICPECADCADSADVGRLRRG